MTPRGAGTGLSGGAVPVYGGILLCMDKMNKILEWDLDTMTVVIEPGVLVMELANAALEKGVFYPPEPGEKTASVGGNVMTNAGGMKAVGYGVTRNYVVSMECVMPDGTVMQFGSNVAKNTSGYDLKDLIIGSEAVSYTHLEANPGGAPCNVLAILNKLGKKAGFIGKVGNDGFGRMLRDTLQDLGRCV